MSKDKKRTNSGIYFIKEGYQPTIDNLDRSNPPKASGYILSNINSLMKRKEQETQENKPPEKIDVKKNTEI